MNRAQRVVLVVALGVALVVVTTALTHQWDSTSGIAGGGWFAYAPETAVVFSRGSSWPIWRDALAWLVAVVLWGVAALFLLRTETAAGEVTAVRRPSPSRRTIGTALGWVVFVLEVALGVAFGWLWWVVAVFTSAGLLLSRRTSPSAGHDEETT